MKKHNKNPMPQIIVNEAATEYKRPVLYGVLFRFVISCLISVGFLFTLIDIYKLPINLGVCFFLTIGFQLVFFTALSCTRKLFVFFGTGVVTAAAALILNQSLVYAVLYFKDCILITLDSRLLHTLRYLSFKTWKLTEANSGYTRGILIVFVFLTTIIALITALCTYKKPRCFTILGVFAAFFAAAFIAEKCEFRLSMLPFFIGVFMLFVISSSYTSEKLLACIRGANVRAADREFEKRNKKRKLYKKLKHRMLRYGKYKTNAVWGAALASLALLAGVVLFNDNKYIDYTEVYATIAEAGTNIKNFFSSFSFGSSEVFDEYFGTSYKGKNNSSLSITSPGNGERDILKVTVEDVENAVYLRGDIGVDFNGESWSTLPESYNDKYASLFENYIPETETKTLYSILTLSGLDVNKYIRLQNVQLDYLQNTDVVMLPTSPYEYSYRNNDNFKVYGDTVIRTSENFIETVECSVAYPLITSEMSTALEWAIELVSLWDMDVLSQIALSSDVPLETLENYSEYQNQYSNYVYETYLDVPEDMQNELDTYIKKNFGETDGYIEAATLSERYNSVYALCEYLRSNYKYSLDFKSDKTNSVLKFLNETKSGHCALYASSMVLILRSLGIPARYCTGFVADGDWVYTNNGYEITLKEKNLHAWAEVYFDEFGWLPFDPTGAAAGGNDSSTQTTPPAVTTPPQTTPPRQTTTKPRTSKPIQTTTEKEKPETEIIDPMPIIIITSSVFAVLLIASAVMFCINTKKRMEKLLQSYRGGNPTKSVKNMYRFIFKLLILCGIEQQKGETLAEFAARIDKLIPSEGMLTRLVPLFEAVEFGREDVSEEERGEVYRYIEIAYNKVISERRFIKRIYLMYKVLK